MGWASPHAGKDLRVHGARPALTLLQGKGEDTPKYAAGGPGEGQGRVVKVGGGSMRAHSPISITWRGSL